MSHVFLAYSRDDRRIMEPLRDYLRDRGIDVWTDEHLSPGTPNWHRAIQQAIVQAAAVIVLMSPNSNSEDSYVHNEIGYSLTHEKYIYPILVSGTNQTAIPISLVNCQYIDLRGRKQQTPDEAYHRLAQELAAKLGITLQEPSSQQINVTVEGNVKGDINVAGRDIKQFFSSKEGKWATALGTLAAVATILTFVFPNGLQDILPNVKNEPTALTGDTGEEHLVAETLASNTPLPAGTEQPSDQREVAATSTLSARPFPTEVPPTPTMTQTLTESQRARQLAEQGISSNDEWTPYTEEINGVRMALVPAGCFYMGSEAGSTDEAPLHKVCFQKPYWIDVYEVTNFQFAALNGEAGRDSIWKEANRPRESITWTESEAFCDLRGARLPTEAEWEYAARGSDGLVYPWGNTFVASNVVYAENNRGVPAPIGSKPGGVSWVGAYDLSGNVWEWVNDWYDPGYYGTLADGVNNPEGPGTGDTRVLRGGSWRVIAYNVRAAVRLRYAPSVRDDGFGFRCALSYNS